MRKTKIIATLGPSTDSAEMVGRLIDAGMNLARLNMQTYVVNHTPATVGFLQVESSQCARRRLCGETWALALSGPGRDCGNGCVN